MMPRRFGWLPLLGLIWATGQAASGQGFLVDRQVIRNPIPINRAYEIREVSIDARVRDQVAEVRVAQTFHNPGSTQIEAEYLFPLPEDAGVQDLVLMVDGKELPGRVLPKDEARRIYEEIVRTRRDPALLEFMGRGLFRASVFPIPPGADRQVTLRYTQICKRDRDVVEFAYPLATQKYSSKPIRKLTLNLTIDGRDAIKSIYCPSHDVVIARSGEREAKVSLDRRDVVPTGDFKLVYTLAEGSVGATVLSYRPDPNEDGYFLLLASPEVKAPEARALPKTVLFVLDRSGSMAGKKLEQARNALQFVLNNLRDDDTFNIIAYDDRVEAFKPELQRYSPSSRAEAEKFVANIREGGSTNIDGALQAALGMIADDSRPNYVLFLTDGLPTAGQTNELKIAENTRGANKYHARVFSFGVGFDVNARMLDRISGGNGGTSEYVRPDEDLEAHVGAFYSKMTRPAFAAIAINLAGSDVNRTYPRDLPDLFEGGQLVWVGRYRTSGKATIRLSGKVGGESRSFEFPAELASPGSGTGRDFVEKLWAVRRVGFIIDKIDLNGPNKELTDELVVLGTKYGLLTPYTSFLADERQDLHAGVSSLRSQAMTNLDSLSIVQGEAGTSQRAFKRGYINAERFEDVAKSSDPRLATAGSHPNSPAAPAGGMMGGMGGRMYSKAKAIASSPVAAGVTNYQAAPQVAGKPVAVNVRNLGVKTFYRKADRWVDSEVKPEDDAKAIVVEQFSEAFFQLARGQSAEQNQYFTFEEPVTVRIDGKVYRVDPPNSK
jgi:Ca-activated chloride channel family protein